jgi:hypothetical protein
MAFRDGFAAKMNFNQVDLARRLEGFGASSSVELGSRNTVHEYPIDL